MNEPKGILIDYDVITNRKEEKSKITIKITLSHRSIDFYSPNPMIFLFSSSFTSPGNFVLLESLVLILNISM